MSFKEIDLPSNPHPRGEGWQNQEFAVRVLKTHLAKSRLAHTYLMTGKKEAGKEGITLAFAQALLCEKGKLFQDCDCVSCRKIVSHNHPDVRWVGEDTKTRSIKIEEMREMIHWSTLKPYEGKWKVFIFVDAERLTLEAQNAILKTLEEPPAQTIFCLLVENKSHLLETIQSRSFEIRLRPVSSDREEEDNDAQALAGIGQKSWDDLLEPYQTASREEVKGLVDSMMRFFRNQCQGGTSGKAVASWLDAIDLLYETKEALDANANQKLALTRLTMRLTKVLPTNSR